MSFVIYDIHNAKRTNKTYSTLRGAKSALGRMHNDNFAVASVEDYFDKIDTDITVTNLMTGEPATIRKSQRGTVCDPSMERYFTF